jgi:hypothetical protein
MKTDEYNLRLVLHILYLTGNYLQKSRFQNKKLNNSTQEFKLKILNSKNLETSENLATFISNIVSCDLDDLLVLKMLHSINFKDPLDQQNIKRTIANTLLCTYSNLSIPVEECSVTNKSYLLTLIIQNVYQYYKLKYSLTVNVEKNYYEP